MSDENGNNTLNSAPGIEGGGPHQDETEEATTLDSGRPAVASSPGKVLVFVIAALVFIGIVVKSLFFSGGGPVENKVKKPPERVQADSRSRAGEIALGDLPSAPPQEPIPSYGSSASNGYSSSGGGPTSPNIGALPTPSPLLGENNPLSSGPGGSIKSPDISATAPIIAPNSTTSGGALNAPDSALPPPPPPPGLTAPGLPDVKTSGPKDEKELKRIQSDSMVTNNSSVLAPSTAATASPTSNSAGPGFSGSDRNSQFAAAAISASRASSVTSEQIPNLDYTIVQGKIINAVLETAIDSDLPGELRAVVSHDTYAEVGRQILIPKGSRLIGTYNSNVVRGQARVFIIWTRVIRPDGITIAIGSPAIDDLGRAGLVGDVDNKYFEMFSTALLTSTLDIGVAAIGQGLFGTDQSTSTTNSGTGGTTTSSSASGQAMQEAVTNIGQVGKTIVSNTLGLSPTITVDQGTPVNIFVNKELIIPVTGNENLFFESNYHIQ